MLERREGETPVPVDELKFQAERAKFLDYRELLKTIDWQRKLIAAHERTIAELRSENRSVILHSQATIADLERAVGMYKRMASLPQHLPYDLGDDTGHAACLP